MATWGSVPYPVRSGADDMLVAHAQQPAGWWVGVAAEDGWQAIGPHGPWSQVPGGGLLSVIGHCTSLVLDPLVAQPWIVVESAHDASRLPAPRWVVDPQLCRPDSRVGVAAVPIARRLPRGRFWREVLRSALWWGMGHVACAVDAGGQPIAGSLMQLHPDAVAPGDSGQWLIGDGASAVATDTDGWFELGGAPWRLLTWRNPLSPVGPDGRSIGVFGMWHGAIDTAARVRRYQRQAYRAGVPAGYLKVTQPNFSADAAESLKASWLRAHGGDQRSIAVLGASAEFRPLAWSPVDAGLVDALRASIAEVALAFGLPPQSIGVSLGASMTYSNVAQWLQERRDTTLVPWETEIRDVGSALLPGSQTLMADMEHYGAGSLTQRLTAWQSALAAGVVTVDEARQHVGLPPLRGGSAPAQQASAGVSGGVADAAF